MIALTIKLCFMKKFMIERNIPSVGKLRGEELKAACQKSNDTLNSIKGDVQWVNSFVTKDKLYCVYIAEDEAGVKEHAAVSGFPADRIEIITNQIDPTSAT